MKKPVGLARDEQMVLHERAVRLAQPVAEEEHADKTQLLVLRLGDEWYALDVTYVREVMHDVEITRVPCAPSYVVGVLSVRGEIVSVCDLRRTLGITAEVPEMPPVVVVEVGEITSSIIADDLADIVEVPSVAIEPVLATIDRTAAEYVMGEVTVDDRLVAILNLEHLIRPEEG